jgi:hypothetical protein
MNTKKEQLRLRASSGNVLGQDTYAVRAVDITGGGLRRFAITRDDLAREAMSQVINGHDDDFADRTSGSEVLAGLAKMERRRGARRLVGTVDIASPVQLSGRRAVVSFDSPVYESLADSLAESSAMESDGLQFCPATAAALAQDNSDEGRMLAMAGGMEWNGGTQRVKTGQDRQITSKIPRGGIVGSVARYTLKRFGGTLGDDVLRDAAAAAVAAIWAHWQGGQDSMGGCEGLCEFSFCARALWRIGWRAARRAVVAESRAGRTGHGADRLPAMAVYDASRPVADGGRHGAVERAAMTTDDIASYEAWLETGGQDTGLCEGQPQNESLKLAAEWLHTVLAGDMSDGGGMAGKGARQRAAAMVQLLISAHDGMDQDSAWNAAAVAGHYDSADTLREAFAKRGTWKQLAAAAVALPTLAEKESAMLVASWAKAARHWQRAVERGGLFTVKHPNGRAVVGNLFTAKMERAAAAARLRGIRQSSPIGKGHGIRGGIVGKRVYGEVVAAAGNVWIASRLDGTPILAAAPIEHLQYVADTLDGEQVFRRCVSSPVLREWHKVGSVCRLQRKAAGGLAGRRADWQSLTTGIWAGQARRGKQRKAKAVAAAA